MPPNTAGIVTPPDRLLPSSRDEILDLMRTVIEKSQQKITLQLLEVSIACTSKLGVHGNLLMAGCGHCAVLSGSRQA